MRYDSSIYNGLYTGPLNATSGPYNNIAASQAYFADVTELETDVPPATGMGAGMPGPDMGSMTAMPAANNGAVVETGGILGKPAPWWVMLVIVFGVAVFVSRRFGGTEKFGNVRFSLWNLALGTIFMVIMLNFLKVVFAYVRVPGLSTLIAAA